MIKVALLVVCWLLIIVFLFLVLRGRKKAKKAYLDSWVSAPAVPKGKPQPVLANMKQLIVQVDSKKRNQILLQYGIPTSILFGVIAQYVLELSWVLGAIFGLLLPWMVLVQIERNYGLRYKQDGRKAIEFAGTVISAGGTLEDWMREMPVRLDGPLKVIFTRGSQNLSATYTAGTFLEQLIKRCPDSYLQLVFSGMLHEHRHSGDMKKFIDEVLQDIVYQERFERIMGIQRVSGQRMLLYVTAFPLFIYLLFRDAVQRTLELHPMMTVTFIIGTLGYVVFIYFGLRITKSQIL